MTPPGFGGPAGRAGSRLWLAVGWVVLMVALGAAAVFTARTTVTPQASSSSSAISVKDLHSLLYPGPDAAKGGTTVGTPPLSLHLETPDQVLVTMAATPKPTSQQLPTTALAAVVLLTLAGAAAGFAAIHPAAPAAGHPHGAVPPVGAGPLGAPPGPGMAAGSGMAPGPGMAAGPGMAPPPMPMPGMPVPADLVLPVDAVPAAEFAAAQQDRDRLVTVCMDLFDATDRIAVRERLARSLAEVGVIAIDPTGRPFDPARDEAVTRVPTDDPGLHGMVASTERVGFVDGDRLLRPAEVSVYGRPDGR